MDYFLWDIGGDVDDASLCFIQDAPAGLGLHAASLALGDSVEKHMPDQPRIKLRKENPGLALPGFIGNTKGFLILSSAGVRVVREHCPGEKLEVFPFELINHKNRVHSTDYSIVNPLTAVRCLDHQASGAKLGKKGEVIAVQRVVLARKAVEDAPHLFRIAEMPGEYVFSRALGRALNKAGVSNVWGNELAQV
jgi:hypothetical protein